jgi:hypothetical protein
MTEVELSMRPILDEVNFFGELSEEEEKELAEEFLDRIIKKFKYNNIEACVDVNRLEHKIVDYDGAYDLDPYMEDLIQEVSEDWDQ